MLVQEGVVYLVLEGVVLLVYNKEGLYSHMSWQFKGNGLQCMYIGNLVRNNISREDKVFSCISHVGI